MAEMKYAAALFDLDGTLQDSEIHWIRATQAFLNDSGIPYDLDMTTRLVYGRSSTEIYNEIAAMPPFAGRTVEDLADCIRDFYKRMTTVTDIGYPTSIALLRRMAADMPVAIVSGSPKLDVGEAAVRLGVADAVSLVLGAEDATRGKPDPECFLKAASLLGVEPSRCIVFEDSAAGVMAAKRGGMTCVAVSRPGRPSQDVSMADFTVSDLGEFAYP